MPARRSSGRRVRVDLRSLRALAAGERHARAGHRHADRIRRAPPGLGKTHLLGAIASLAVSHTPTLAIRWTTGEAFTNEFVGALADGNIESFKARFRDIDMLLMDDVQFLERKTRTEEEFFHT